MGKKNPVKRNRRRLGARSYKNYSEEMLQLAVELVNNKKTSSYDAEKQFGIPRRTIEKRAKNLHCDKPGPHFRLSNEEETKFVNVLIAAADFGSPLSMLELRLAVYDYLKKNNKTHVFNEKPPGEWWVRNFLERNKERLTLRITQNITKARAEKTMEEFKAYFENLKESVENIPPANILNYDETNVSDDPGTKKCIFRRGVKYPERIMNHTKGCISLMFAGTADGKVLAPYVVYKSANLWTQWCSDGPEGAIYNRTSSGWFDSNTFFDWFTKIVIAWASQLKGPKLVIGDNLSSHLNPDVIELCEAHEIRFVFLPSRSTQIAQPLDVAFFGPLKKSWRQILLKYKVENPSQTSLNKSHFPLLLKQLMEAANINSENVKSGFKATGINPFNPYQIYKKLPEFEEEIKYDVHQSLLQYLKETKQPNPIKRGKNSKLNVPPGKSVTSLDIQQLQLSKLTKKKKENLNVNSLTNEPNAGVKKGTIKILSNIVIKPGKKIKQNEDALEKIKVTDKDISKAQDIEKHIINTQKSKIHHEKVNVKVAEHTQHRKRKQKAANKKEVDKVKIRRIHFTKKKITGSRKTSFSSESSNSDCTIQLCDSSDYDPDVADAQDHLADKTEIEYMDQIMNDYETPNVSYNKERKQQKRSKTENDTFIRFENSTDFAKVDIQVNAVGYLSDENNSDNDKQAEDSRIYNTERERRNDPQILRDNTNTYIRIKQEKKNLQENEKSSPKTKLEETESANGSPITNTYIYKDSELGDPEEKENDLHYEIEYTYQKIGTTKKKQILHEEQHKTNTVYVNKKNTNLQDINKKVSIQEKEMENSYLEQHEEREYEEKEIENGTKERDQLYKTEIENINPKIIITQEKNMIFLANERQVNDQKRIETVHARENENILEKNDDKNPKKDQFTMGQTVLARYFLRQKWKYYCGVITDIIEKVENCYKISYFKTINKNDTHIFIQPKREDVDNVPETVIVKPIKLLQISEDPIKFTLMDDEDSIWFQKI